MKKIEEILQQNPLLPPSGNFADAEPASVSTTLNQSSNKEKELSASTKVHDLRMDILFSRLGVIYGQNWWNNFRTKDLLALGKEEWGNGLERFDNQVLKEVLVIYREKKIYPPSLPQFIECCKEIMSRRAPALLKKEITTSSNRKLAREYLKAMLQKLNN